MSQKSADNKGGSNTQDGDTVRLDRWLWAARFFKTRAVAKQAVEGGKVHVDGKRAKPSRNIHAGHTVVVTTGEWTRTVNVLGVSERRGPARDAQLLYEETIQSIERRETIRSERRMQRAGLKVPDTRPSKRDRRALSQLKERSSDGQDTPL